MKNIRGGNLLDFFMETTKGRIQHGVHLLEPKSLKNTFKVVRKVESKNVAAKRIATNTYRENNVPSSNLIQTTRLTPNNLSREEKGNVVNCAIKYS